MLSVLLADVIVQLSLCFPLMRTRYIEQDVGAGVG